MDNFGHAAKGPRNFGIILGWWNTLWFGNNPTPFYLFCKSHLLNLRPGNLTFE
jgi:hypothetical protein